jgi:hypothetical protein
MKNEKKLTVRHENFIHYVLQGYSYTDSYIKCFPQDKEKRSLTKIYSLASQLFNDPDVHAKYLQLKEMMQRELQERALWTKEQAINELKELLRKNRVESDRYEQAYNDEIEMLDRQIEEKENEIKRPKGYQSKKLKASLQDEIDGLKMARIQCNRRHQSNKSVNEAILSSVQQLNEMLGYTHKEDEKMQVRAQVSFVDNIPEKD